MKKVLIVDDELSSSEIINFFIKKYNLPLEIIGTIVRGDIALKKIQKLKPDLVFMDIEMPGMNGLDVIENTNKVCSSNISYIIITAYNKFDYAQKALRLGAKDLLLKPIQYNQFCEAMQRVIGYQYSANPIFNQLLEYIHSSYMEEISLESCALILNTSTTNVARLLKKNLNTNFTSYYNKVRINKAIELLETGSSIKDAALAVGYQNLNYFYTRFKQEVGITPREYIDNKSAN